METLTLTGPDPATPGDAVRHEVSRIYFDPSHRLHAAYTRNPQDREVESYISGLYAKTYGGSPSATGPSPDANRLESNATSTSELDAASANALTPEDARSFEQLQQEWGEHFETRMSEARFGISRLAGHLGASVDDLSAACLDAGLDLRTIVKILSHYEQRMRAFEQGA
jgi:hypothetical protein